jgi:circadian clock protein KaiB
MTPNYPRMMYAGTDADGGLGHYSLRLYVTGGSDKSLSARANLRRVCDQHLEGRYDLEVVDLAQNPALAAHDRILATPALVRREPGPVKRIVGDLSDTDKLLVDLGIRRKTKAA